jgi:membrane protease YdiL (CAAX protease family)
MLLKNQESEVRLIWRLVLLVVPFLLAAYLLRYVPIRIRTEVLINQGLSKSAALSRARYLFLEDPVWSSLVGTIQGLIWYPIVFILIKRVEKRPRLPGDYGFVPLPRAFWLVPAGILLALSLYFGYFWFGSLFNQTSFSWSPAEIPDLTAFLISLNFLTNGYGEETAFRAYFQDRLIQRHGLWTGIILASSSFVLLHLLLYRYSGLALVGSILLAGIYGVFYVWTGSIYLIGTMHAVFNLAPRLFGQWHPDIGLLFVHSLVLLIVLVFFVRFKKGQKRSL